MPLPKTFCLQGSFDYTPNSMARWVTSSLKLKARGSCFCLEIYEGNIFLFFKIYFYLKTLKE